MAIKLIEYTDTIFRGYGCIIKLGNVITTFAHPIILLVVENVVQGWYYMDKYYLSKKRFKKDRKGGMNMAILAKPYNAIIMIDKDKSKQFLEDSKKNIIQPGFLKDCLKIASMVKREVNKIED